VIGASLAGSAAGLIGVTTDQDTEIGSAGVDVEPGVDRQTRIDLGVERRKASVAAGVDGIERVGEPDIRRDQAGVAPAHRAVFATGRERPERE